MMLLPMKFISPSWPDVKEVRERFLFFVFCLDVFFFFFFLFFLFFFFLFIITQTCSVYIANVHIIFHGSTRDHIFAYP